MSTESNKVVQIAYVVDDLDVSMGHWLQTGKTGPFFVNRHIAVEDFVYRGTKGFAHDISVGMAQAGEVMIELIQQHNPEPSAYRDVFPDGGNGFHHLYSFADFDSEMERLKAAGHAVAHSGRLGNIRFAYVDTREALGGMTECCDDVPELRALYATVAGAAENWDGSDPIRSFEK